MGKRKRANRIGQYMAVPWAIKNQPAWRAMSPEARLLWIELRGWLRSDWSNNGRLFLSCRKAAKAIGLNKDTITRSYAENEYYGFLRKISGGYLGSDGRGIAASYCFTDLPYDTQPATRDYAKWYEELFVYRRSKKQNPVRSRRTPCPVQSDIRRASKGASVCPVPSDIGEPPRCPTAPDITSFPLPPAGEAKVRGSSTARAPARAGGAGSSPAPVSNLTEYVLRVMNAELEGLR